MSLNRGIFSLMILRFLVSVQLSSTVLEAIPKPLLIGTVIAPARHRVSPYPLFSPNEAVGTIFREIRTLSTEKKQVSLRCGLRVEHEN